MSSIVIDLLEDEQHTSAEAQAQDASYLLAMKLQAEEDALGARILAPRKRKHEKEDSEGPSLMSRTTSGLCVGQSLPPSVFRIRPVSDHIMQEVHQVLKPFDATLCEDEVSMPRQWDNWTCGYENLSSLLRSIGRRGLHDVPTDLRPLALQKIIEEAWRAGFSPRDCTTLIGTSKWIGGPEWIIALWHLRLNAIIIEIAGDGQRHARGPGGAGQAVMAAVRTCLSLSTDLPILLQHHGHSRMVLGTLARPPRLVLRDPNDPLHQFRCFAPHELDGKQYQIVVVCNRASSPPNRIGLSVHESQARRGEPATTALWTSTGWEYDSTCKMRFS